MILTVTLNAALDVTYTVESLVPGATHRVLGVSQRAGGKGINVARVLHALGHPVLATGLASSAVLSDLTVPHSFASISGESRRTVTVVAEGEATLFNEPGPEVSAAEWLAFVDHFRSLAQDATVVALSGSMPPGVPPDGYAQLVSTVDCPTIVDTSGAALRHALAAHPDVVKPNADELREVTGLESPQAGASTLLRDGARAVVATLGPDGLLAVTERESWQLAPPGKLAGNPTGAGDACVAGIAAGLHTGAAWPALLREAVALSAAAVLHPVAGGFDTNAYAQLRANLPPARKAL
ncbi:1-phosphofructokinase family hexose kinase [Allokutzneria albata]|uniref:Tagatose 6-phosphate kinase n=1 Tax=Allokutzneria albata TaxID=211114 RepID=A0A1G9VXE5_ALLAB|nr:hexose kinase [Allokutzneria albata]SDM76515.1 tagatose 6-phosphate kinase [Allokutzneria albata]